VNRIDSLPPADPEGPTHHILILRTDGSVEMNLAEEVDYLGACLGYPLHDYEFTWREKEMHGRPGSEIVVKLRRVEW